jgi:hypothetical protein
MDPRIAYRTHYQVDEPIYLGILIEEATSPTRSEYSERVAARFARAIQSRNIRFNIPAAGYAVDLARRLGLINDQNVWTPLGHLVHLFTNPRDGELSEALGLDDLERLLYFRVFFEGDGAAFLFLANHLNEHGGFPSPGADDWNTLAHEMFLWSYSEYLPINSAPAERVGIRRELDRLRRNGFKGKTGSHKLSIHLQTMVRVGLASSSNGSKRTYSPDLMAIPCFLNKVTNVIQLETLIKESRWVEPVACLRPDSKPYSIDSSRVRPMLAEFYERITATGVAICPISTVRDAIQLTGLSMGLAWSSSEILEWLRQLQRETPKNFRFHVDRQGVPAFLKLDRYAIDMLVS